MYCVTSASVGEENMNIRLLVTFCRCRSTTRFFYSVSFIISYLLLFQLQFYPIWRDESVALTTAYDNEGKQKLINQMSALEPASGDQLEAASGRKPLNLPECSDIPPNLVGPINVFVKASHVLSTEHFTGVEAGGRWRPRDCVARHRVAIVVPFRDRWDNLLTLLYYLIPVLKRQQLDFRIFVVEQVGNVPFNKGRLMNAGFLEAMKEGDYQCVIFHDVDLIPENDKNMYSCAANPKHLSVLIDKFNYEIFYEELIGGVLIFPIDDYRQVNGYTNLLWAWGGEDDEMWERIQNSRLTLSRPSPEVARYKAIPHLKRRHGNSIKRKNLLKNLPQRIKKDGLNGVSYNVTSKVYEKLYTHLLVDVGKPEITPSIALLCMVYC